MKDLAPIDHFTQPRAVFPRALYRHEQRQQPPLVLRARVFAQRLPERQMLRPGVRREPRGVGREKGERGFCVLAVFGEIEVHPADQVPGRIARFQKILERASELRELRPKCRIDFLPQGAQHPGVQIFRAGHRRRVRHQRFEFFRRWGRYCRGVTAGFLCGAFGSVLRCAHCGDIARAELAPPGKERRQRRAHFARAELQQAVARAAREGCLDALRQLFCERGGVLLRSENQVAVRSEKRRKRGG